MHSASHFPAYACPPLITHPHPPSPPQKLTPRDLHYCAETTADVYDNNHLFKIPMGGKLYVKLTATNIDNGCVLCVCLSVSISMDKGRVDG